MQLVLPPSQCFSLLFLSSKLIASSLSLNLFCVQGNWKMGRSKDLFWEFVEDLNGCFECKFFGSNFAMSATRIYIYIYIWYYMQKRCFASFIFIMLLDTLINWGKVDYFIATNGKKLDEKFQSLEEKLQDMQRDIQNPQLQTLGALDCLNFLNMSINSFKEIEDHLRDDIVW